MTQLRRLLAVFAFVTGGLAAELARPVYCSLLNVASTAPGSTVCRRKRAKV
jgi:hypothetical protein